jgi:hypothetical protein
MNIEWLHDLHGWVVGTHKFSAPLKNSTHMI